MRTVNPRVCASCRRAFAVGLALLFIIAGCKSKDGGGGGGGSGQTRDPLVYGPTRIPPQNVPLPERGGVGSKGTKVDPFFASPTGKSGDKTGVGYSDGPERFQGTFVPGAGSVPAALAAKKSDGEELKIESPDGNRVPLKQVGGVVPVGATEPGDGLESLYAELAKYGMKPADRTLVREDGQFVFRASVPISGNGARRHYEGTGTSANQAVKQVLDSVIADPK